MDENEGAFLDQCERILVNALAPFAAGAERIMQRLEEWIEDVPSIGVQTGADYCDWARTEGFPTDLGPGMLTEELLTDVPLETNTSKPRWPDQPKPDIIGGRNI